MIFKPDWSQTLKKIALIASVFLSIQAEDLSHQALIDIIDSYRKSELKEVENKIQTLLVNKDYWLSVLRDQDVAYGYYENKEYIFVSNKDIPDLRLYRFDKGVLSEIGKSDALVGSGKGDKKISGDLTTPIGVYDLKNKLTKLDQYYGAMAFVTSYPNAYDRSLKRTGYGIWIHGMPLNGNREEINTKGCIAIENEIIISYDKQIKFGNTILLTYEGNYIPASKDEVANILSQIYLWKDAWEKGDFDNYIAFYSSEFKKPNGVNYEAYRKYKSRIFSKNEDKQIKISQIDVTPYPNEEAKRLFRVSFHQEYTAFNKNKEVSYRSNGKKELYLQLLEDGSISILLEE